MAIQYGKTRVRICRNNEELGKTVAIDIAQVIRDRLKEASRISIVFSAGESQLSFLRALVTVSDIEWQRIVAFAVDDFWEPALPAHLTCAALLRVELAERVSLSEFHCLNHAAADAEEEAQRYEALVRKHAPFDIACLGIGRSGHIALNEPGETDFADERLVRVVRVAEASQRQLMEDPHFGEAKAIPDCGITLTMHALLASRHCVTMVPLASKRPILEQLAQTTEPTPELPASILLTANGTLYVDQDSCPSLWKAM